MRRGYSLAHCAAPARRQRELVGAKGSTANRDARMCRDTGSRSACDQVDTTLAQFESMEAFAQRAGKARSMTAEAWVPTPCVRQASIAPAARGIMRNGHELCSTARTATRFRVSVRNGTALLAALVLSKSGAACQLARPIVGGIWVSPSTSNARRESCRGAVMMDRREARARPVWTPRWRCSRGVVDSHPCP